MWRLASIEIEFTLSCNICDKHPNNERFWIRYAIFWTTRQRKLHFLSAVKRIMHALNNWRPQNYASEKCRCSVHWVNMGFMLSSWTTGLLPVSSVCTKAENKWERKSHQLQVSPSSSSSTSSSFMFPEACLREEDMGVDPSTVISFIITIIIIQRQSREKENTTLPTTNTFIIIVDVTVVHSQSPQPPPPPPSY